MVERICFDMPRKVWVDDGHVLIEQQDGTTLILAAETALALSRMLAQAGTDSLINKVLDGEI